MFEISQHDCTWDKLGFCLRKKMYFWSTLLVSKVVVVSLILLGMTHPSVPSIHPLLQHKAHGDQLGVINRLPTGKGSLSDNIWAILFFLPWRTWFQSLDKKWASMYDSTTYQIQNLDQYKAMIPPLVYLVTLRAVKERRIWFEHRLPRWKFYC